MKINLFWHFWTPTMFINHRLGEITTRWEWLVTGRPTCKQNLWRKQKGHVDLCSFSLGRRIFPEKAVPPKHPRYYLPTYRGWWVATTMRSRLSGWLRRWWMKYCSCLYYSWNPRPHTAARFFLAVCWVWPDGIVNVQYKMGSLKKRRKQMNVETYV